MINRICSWLVFLFACAIPASPAFSAGADIWSALKQGGHVILIRHGAVDNLSRSTSPDADFEGCEGQYNLTDEGRDQVKRLGKLLQSERRTDEHQLFERASKSSSIRNEELPSTPITFRNRLHLALRSEKW